MKPLLRWAGGKRWAIPLLASGIRSHLLETKGRYIEPFVGGGAMALHLSWPRMILGDAEEDLIHTYVALRDCPEEVADVLEALSEIGTDKESYYLVRETPADDWVESAGRFIYLNKLCFNGIHRKNRSGQFNVPFGGNRELPSRDRIFEISDALQGAELHAKDFSELISKAVEGDIVYADPPYDESFGDYTKAGFSREDQRRLACSLRSAHQRGVAIITHNADTELVRDLYWWAYRFLVDEKRAVNSDGTNRDGASCVIAFSDPKLLTLPLSGKVSSGAAEALTANQ